MGVTKTRGGSSSESLSLEGVDELTAALLRVATVVRKDDLRRKITRKAGKYIVEVARKLAPRIKGKWAQKLDGGGVGKVRYAKKSGQQRAKRGEGDKVATYRYGNLAGSIRVLALNKTTAAIIGPFIRKKGQGEGDFGPGTRKFDGYYAQMVYANAHEFRARIMEKALVIASGAAAQSMIQDLDAEVTDAARKNGLNVK